MNMIIEQSPLPSRHAVRSTLQDLVGRDVDLFDGTPVPPKASNVVAVYVTDKLAVAAVSVINIEGAARLGGALGLIPRGGVDDAIDGKDLSGPMRENCFEVLNVVAGLLNGAGAPHVRLYEMYGPNGQVPPDVSALSAATGPRLDVRFTVAGYGDGLLSLVVR